MAGRVGATARIKQPSGAFKVNRDDGIFTAMSRVGASSLLARSRSSARLLSMSRCRTITTAIVSIRKCFRISNSNVRRGTNDDGNNKRQTAWQISRLHSQRITSDMARLVVPAELRHLQWRRRVWSQRVSTRISLRFYDANVRAKWWIDNDFPNIFTHAAADNASRVYNTHTACNFTGKYDGINDNNRAHSHERKFNIDDLQNRINLGRFANCSSSIQLPESQMHNLLAANLRASRASSKVAGLRCAWEILSVLKGRSFDSQVVRSEFGIWFSCSELC